MNLMTMNIVKIDPPQIGLAQSNDWGRSFYRPRLWSLRRPGAAHRVWPSAAQCVIHVMGLRAGGKTKNMSQYDHMG
jgi:hypothetical protein